MGILGGLGSLLSLNLYARLGIVAVVVAGLWFTDRNWQYYKGKSVGDKQGEQRTINKVKDNNAKATEIGESAANKSGKPAPRGVRRIPGYRY